MYNAIPILKIIYNTIPILKIKYNAIPILKIMYNTVPIVVADVKIREDFSVPGFEPQRQLYVSEYLPINNEWGCIDGNTVSYTVYNKETG